MDGWFYESNGERRGPLGLDQMRELVKAGAIRRDTRVWRPGAADSDLTRAGDFLGELAVAPSNDGLKHVLPIGRSGWAIAAGYLGLMSFIPILCYLGLIVSIVAAVHLKKNPTLLGWGRVITGLVISIPASLFYTFAFLR